MTVAHFVVGLILLVVGFASGWYSKDKWGVKAATVITDIRK
jgi:hypothetical protein